MKKYFLILSICLPSITFSQNPTMARQTVSQSGFSGDYQNGNTTLFIQQSIGQGSAIGTTSHNNLTLRQGFIQSDKLVAKAISSQEEELEILVYPNPFRNDLHLEILDEIESEISIQILDISGRVVFAENRNNQNSVDLHISNLSSGSYILFVIVDNKKFTTNIQKL